MISLFLKNETEEECQYSVDNLDIKYKENMFCAVREYLSCFIITIDNLKISLCHCIDTRGMKKTEISLN